MSEDMVVRPAHEGPKHYYGDVVRMLFVAAAVLILAAHVVGGSFLTVGASLVAVVILAVAAGLTNPVQAWVHWVNTGISAIGLFASGSVLLTHVGSAEKISTPSIVALLLTLIFVFALYTSTKTLRGILMRFAPEIR
jgi:hypothetical protein